jgi:PPOX class probable F420-dependent enzyme
MATDLDLVRRIGAADHGLAIVAVTRPDGSVQASLVNAGVLADPDGREPCIAFVAQGSAAKLHHIRRDGRATVVFRAGWEWVSVDGAARIAGGDPQLLRDVFTAAGGTHDDWDEYDRVMASEHRVAVIVQPTRIVSNG